MVLLGVASVVISAVALLVLVWLYWLEHRPFVVCYLDNTDAALPLLTVCNIGKSLATDVTVKVPPLGLPERRAEPGLREYGAIAPGQKFPYLVGAHEVLSFPPFEVSVEHKGPFRWGRTKRTCKVDPNDLKDSILPDQNSRLLSLLEDLAGTMLMQSKHPPENQIQASLLRELVNARQASENAGDL